jgi:hypothetical protein
MRDQSWLPNTSLELTMAAGGSAQDALDAGCRELAAQLEAVRLRLLFKGGT